MIEFSEQEINYIEMLLKSYLKQKDKFTKEYKTTANVILDNIDQINKIEHINKICQDFLYFYVYLDFLEDDIRNLEAFNDIDVDIYKKILC